MIGNKLLHYLPGNKSYQLLKQLIKTFYGFDLILLNLDGEFIEGSVKDPGSFCRQSDCHEQASLPKQFLDMDVLEEVREDRQSRIFESQQCRSKQIVVPVVQKKSVIGFLFVKEDKGIRLSDTEIQITLKFLEDFVRLLLKSDLEFAEYFQDRNLTHQQCVIQDVVLYLHENYHNAKITLKDVASWRGISYSYLSSLFKKEMKMSFSRFLNNVRVEKARKLLKSKSLPVSQVAYQCGFDDPGYFSKLFKRNIGISPVDFRGAPSSSAAKSARRLECAKAKNKKVSRKFT